MALLNTISGYQPLLALTDSPVDPTGPPDDRSGTSYVATGELLLATEVALATGRPLLLRGAPGSGKSSWASYVARNLGWRYHESVVTANTELSDFYYRFDAVRRLQDAQRGKSGGDLEPFRYLTPGPLWLGFNWSDALDLLKRQQRSVAILPHGKLNQNRDAERAVVLIDELDKADSSLPNGLLDAIASRQFSVEPLDGIQVQKVKPNRPTARLAGVAKRAVRRTTVNDIADLLIVFTTNEERDLPEAFLRRCVVFTLPDPDAERLQCIAWLRRGRSLEDARNAKSGTSDHSSFQTIRLFAEATVAAWKQAQAREVRGPSTAEFLDLVAAWDRIGFEPQGDVLLHTLRATFEKSATGGVDSAAALKTAQVAVGTASP